MDPILTFNKQHEAHEIPKIKTGDTIRVHQKITEGEKQRIQMFEGLVIKISSGNGTGKTFTIRKITNGIAVEKIFPFLLPAIIKIELLKRGKTRRSKLYYIRDKQPKESRLKEIKLTDEQKAELSYDQAALDEAKKVEEEKKEALEKKDEPKEEKATEETPEKKENPAPSKKEA